MWGVITDPDGKVRDRNTPEEKAQYLGDVKTELAFVNNLRPGRILDVGCGLGWFLSAVNDSWEKYGVEVSECAAVEAGTEGTIYSGWFEDTHFPDGYFNVVILHHVIEHMVDPKLTLDKIHRLLVPGGHLVLGTPDFDSPVARRFGERYRLLYDPTHSSFFSRDSMHKLLSDTGFIVDNVDLPFFNTRHFTMENLERLFDMSVISPPALGNYLTFYCRRDGLDEVYDSFMELSRLASSMADTVLESVQAAFETILDSMRRGGKILVCGNGGSAAAAAHFATELVGGMNVKGKPRPAISLSSDPALLTALANDYGAWDVFSTQVRGLGRQKDTLVAVTASGTSENIARAIVEAHAKKMRVIILCGSKPMAGDVVISVPSANTQRIQEMHTLILHCIAGKVEEALKDV